MISYKLWNISNSYGLTSSLSQENASLGKNIHENIFPAFEKLDDNKSLSSVNISEYKNEQKTNNLVEWISIKVFKLAKTFLSPESLESFNTHLIEATNSIENYHIVFSIQKCWVKAHCMKIKGWLLSDKELMQKAEIKLAKGVDHGNDELGKNVTKRIFGDHNVLSTARNIATKEVLSNEEDKNAYLELRKTFAEKIQDKKLASFTGFHESDFEDDFINQKENFEPKSANRKGVCLSACMFLIEKLVTEPELGEELLIEHANELENGVPAKVAAIHEIYKELRFKEQVQINIPSSKSDRLRFCDRITNFLCNKAMRKGLDISSDDRANIQQIVEDAIRAREKKNLGASQKIISMNEVLVDIALEIFTAKLKELNTLIADTNIKPEGESDVPASNSGIPQRLKNLSPQLKSVLLDSKVKNYNRKNNQSVAAHLYGIEKDQKGTGEAKRTLGSFKNKRSSKEHLKNLANLNPGIYEFIIGTGKGSHAILYVNIKGCGYLFDPNYGLIKCNEKNPSETFLKLLSSYRPPSEKLQGEDGDVNYRLKFTKYQKSSSNDI